jgi:hypothetical protein
MRIHVLRPTRQENRRDAYSTFARDRSKERRHLTCPTLRADTLTPNISIPSAREPSGMLLPGVLKGAAHSSHYWIETKSPNETEN